MNPDSDSCYHEAGSCGRIDDDTDSDGDSVNDAAETRLGTDPLEADTDQDGHTDGDELDCGSVPLDRAVVCP
ncbi:MAG: hypothetical protein Q8O67_31595 [Deltaproteobacteria bacterium]|nr:hypothetical protein [Deltaproteobacteria bacterium]